jgi:hypothetical protein
MMSNKTQGEMQMKTSARNRHTVKSTAKFAAWFAGAALAMGATTGALAQDNGQTGTTQGGDAVQQANPAPGGAASMTRAQRKAAQKQARKEARAKRNAELKQLEENGYQPGRDDPNYPQDLQNAQRKAGIGQGGSQ